MGIFLNELIQFYLNDTINRRHLTPHILPYYTHKMAIYRDHRLCDVTSPYYMYRPTYWLQNWNEICQPRANVARVAAIGRLRLTVFNYS